MKLIPTLHPSYFQRGAWNELPLLARDLRRALQESVWSGAIPRPKKWVEYPTPQQAYEACRIDDRPVIFDIETRIDSGQITHVGIGRPNGQGAATIVCLPWQEPFIGIMRPLFRSERPTKVAHNSLFDVPRLEAGLGITIGEPLWDTLLAWRLLEPDVRRTPVEGIDPYDKLETLASLWWDGRPWKKDPSISMEHYNCIDIDVTMCVYEAQKEELLKMGLLTLARHMMRTLRVVVDMKKRGVCIDLDRQAEVRAKLERRSERAAEKIAEVVRSMPTRTEAADAMKRQADRLQAEAERDHAAPKNKSGFTRKGGTLVTKARKLREEAEQLTTLNVASPVQVRAVLQELFPKKKITSTDDASLVECLRVALTAEAQQLIDGIRILRETDKAIGTYCSFETSNVHPQLLPWGAASGRASCRRPNFQNIPIRKEFSRSIRTMIVPTQPGWRFTQADYSQIELRIQALLANDTQLLAAFERGDDVHSFVGSLIHGVPPEKVTKRQRYFAKRGRYLKSYGGGFMKLQREMAKEGVFVSPAEAKEILQRIGEASPKLEAWADGQVKKAKRDKLLRTKFGRIRWFLSPHVHGEAIAFEPSATVADIIWRRMVQLHHQLPKPAALSMQIHDSIMPEHPRHLEGRVRECLLDVMGSGVPELDGWTCPVDLESGDNWGFEG